jgi:hypothetical protein
VTLSLAHGAERGRRAAHAAVGASTAAAPRRRRSTNRSSRKTPRRRAWQVLKARDWRGVRVLLPVVAGGRRTVIDGLTDAGNTTLVERN